MITKRLARSLGALLAVIGLGAGAALSAPPPPAHAATPTQLTNLRFSWMGGLLQNTQVRYVTVSLTLVDPDGIVPSGVTWSLGRHVVSGWPQLPVCCPRTRGAPLAEQP
jgi:hypothetical protein